MSGRIVLAHGFTQTATSWTRIRSMLADRGFGDTRAVDLPGHGTAGDVRGDLWTSADHLVAAGGTGTYVGYSMGGRVALHAALAHPDAVRRLVLIGATAGIDDATDRARRRADDRALAGRIETIGLDRFLDEWLANPLFATLDAVDAGREDRLRNTTAGLASSLRDAGTGSQEPLWDRLGAIDVPVLVLVGELDGKFRAIGERLLAGLPSAELAVIADAGHSVHLERPEATVEALCAWASTH